MSNYKKSKLQKDIYNRNEKLEKSTNKYIKVMSDKATLKNVRSKLK